jgi:hypothetical protein
VLVRGGCSVTHCVQAPQQRARPVVCSNFSHASNGSCARAHTHHEQLLGQGGISFLAELHLQGLRRVACGRAGVGGSTNPQASRRARSMMVCGER